MLTSTHCCYISIVQTRSLALETRLFAEKKPVVALLAVCTLVGLIFASHFRVYYEIGWPLAIWWGLKDWYLWGVFTPAIVWLTRRAPFSRERWLFPLILHACAAPLLVLAHAVVGIFLSSIVEGLGGISFVGAVTGWLLKKYTLCFLTYVAIVGIAQAIQGARTRQHDESRRSRLDGQSTPATSERLLVHTRGREQFLDVGQIDRIESEGNYVRLHAGGKSYLERRTLASLEAQLDSRQFLRVHRSHVVNIDRIDRMESGLRGWVVVLRDGTRLPLSRTCRRHLGEQVGRNF